MPQNFMMTVMGLAVIAFHSYTFARLKNKSVRRYRVCTETMVIDGKESSAELLPRGLQLPIQMKMFAKRLVSNIYSGTMSQ